MLHRTIRFLVQHSIAMLEQCCNHLKPCRNNVSTLCCTAITLENKTIHTPPLLPPFKVGVFVVFLQVHSSSSISGTTLYAYEGWRMVPQKTLGLRKLWQDLEISEAFLISLEVSFFHGLFLLFLSRETFHQRVSGSDF